MGQLKRILKENPSLVRYASTLLLVVITIALKIPRVPHLQSDDGFVLVIEANSLLNGTSNQWLIHPLSLFGIFSFSGYPIGSVSVLAFFIAISNGSLDLACFYYVSFFSIITIGTTYGLLEYLSKDHWAALVGTAFYLFFPIVYSFTYNDANTRAPLLALLPLFIWALLKWNSEQEYGYLAYSVNVWFVMLFFHRIALLLLAPIVVGALYPFIIRFLEQQAKGQRKRLKVITWSLIIGFLEITLWLIVTSIILFGWDPKNEVPMDIILTDILPISELVNFATDYFLFFGPGLIIAAFGFLQYSRALLHEDCLFSKTTSSYAFLIALATPFAIMLMAPAHTRHLIAPFIACFCVLGIQGIKNLSKGWYIVLLASLVIPFASFFQLYNLFWRAIEPYAMVSLVLMVGAFIFGVILACIPDRRLQPRARNSAKVILVVSILLIVSITNYSIRYDLDIDGVRFARYVTDEEIAVAMYINAQHEAYSDASILLCAHELLELRIGAYAATNILSAGHGTALLIVGFVERADALENSTFQWDKISSPHVIRHPAYRGSGSNPGNKHLASCFPNRALPDIQDWLVR
jgi:hypothetical protein